MSSPHGGDSTSQFDNWLKTVSDRARSSFGAEDRLGTANYIDTAAHLRAARCIEIGVAINLTRPLREGPGFQVETYFEAGHGFDRIDAACHGYSKTHIDALNHVTMHDKFYGGRSSDDDVPTVVDLANHSLFTRAIFADIPAVRGTPWVLANHPVTDTDIEAALTGIEVVPGDALVLYMGRDRWEEAGNTLGAEPGHPADAHQHIPDQKPGAGRLAAQWVVDKQISMVAWDFLDAVDDPTAPTEAKGSLHRLLPTAGLILIDNCELSRAAVAMRTAGRRVAAITASPIATPGGTGSLVNPWLIL